MSASRSAVLTLLSAGMHTLVVDHGRPRTRSLGTPVGGAADRFSLAIGNALVGNPADAAALEVSLVGPTLQSDQPLACVLFGAPFTLHGDQREIRAGSVFTLAPGERLHIGGTPRRMRAYFCVQGGIDALVVLGSRSSLAPLPAGARLACRAGTIGRRRIEESFAALYGARLRVLPGAQADWFPAEALGGDFQVTAASNRMGLRLKGKALTFPAAEIASEPVCPGTVQVTRDGQCILLGMDGQTIGGYPKIAHVIRADLDRLGQLRPGETVGFEPIDLAGAERAAREKEDVLREWRTRLQVTA